MNILNTLYLQFYSDDSTEISEYNYSESRFKCRHKGICSIIFIFFLIAQLGKTMRLPIIKNYDKELTKVPPHNFLFHFYGFSFE